MKPTREEIIQRGHAADALIKSDVFMQCLEAVETQMQEAWKSSRPVDVAERERLYLMVQVMADLGRVLRKWADDARVAVHEAERRAQAPVT